MLVPSLERKRSDHMKPLGSSVFEDSFDVSSSKKKKKKKKRKHKSFKWMSGPIPSTSDAVILAPLGIFSLLFLVCLNRGHKSWSI